VFPFKEGEFVFRKLKPKRPVVIRNGDKVKECFYFRGTHRCIGPLCYWLKVGVCPIYNKINGKKLRIKTRISAK